MNIQQLQSFRPIIEPNYQNRAKLQFSNNIYTKKQYCSTPAFKSNPFKDVSKNPQAMKLFAEFTAVVGAFFAGKAFEGGNAEEQAQETGENNDFTNYLNSFFKQTPFAKEQEEKIAEQDKKISELQQQLSEMNLQISKSAEKQDNKNESPKPTESATTDNIETPAPTEESSDSANEIPQVKFEFPKKRGRLTQKQIILKETVEPLDLDEKYTSRLTDICREFLALTSLKEENPVMQDLMDSFTEKLLASNADSKKIKVIIDDYYNKIVIKTDSADEIRQPRIIGKIELKDDGKNRFPKKPEQTTQEQPPSEKAELPETVPTKETEEKPIISPNKKPLSARQGKESFTFRIPGTPSPNVYDNLAELLSAFKKTLGSDKIWSRRYRVHEKVYEHEIDKEIKNQIEYNMPYTNINSSNIYQVARAINSEPRFKKLFSLHSAMRLIDRYAKFDSDIRLEKQTHEIVNQLFSLLQKAFNDALIVEVRKDRSNDDKIDFYSANIKIPETLFDDNDRKWFGTYPLTVCICMEGKYQKNNNKPIISTIYYPKGNY